MRYILVIILSALLWSCGTNKQTTKKGTISKDALAQLQDKRWVLQRLSDTTVPKMTKEIFVLFDKNGVDVKGFGGCNGFGGSYKTDDKGLHLSNMISTQMWCDYGAIEQKFMHAIQDCDNFIVNGDDMQLLKNNKPVAYFTAVYLNN